MKIILASASPRRNRMLSHLHIPFEKIVAEADERQHLEHKNESVADIAMENALAKAMAVYREYKNGEAFIIGADTVVEIDGIILPKPADAEEAEDMLGRLSGRTHTVITGIAIVKSPPGEKITGFEETLVKFRDIPKDELALYIATGEPFDKAGAYGIQGYGSFFIERIDGDYSNVVGLPLIRLYELMKKAGANIFNIAAENGKNRK